MGLFRPKNIFEGIKIPFLLLKLSGFEFFSITVGSNNELTFHRRWYDVLLFIVSVAYNVAAVHITKTPSFVGIQSKALIGGIIILFRVQMASIIYTKIRRFYLREDSFGALVKMIQIEKKVKSGKLKTIFFNSHSIFS